MEELEAASRELPAVEALAAGAAGALDRLRLHWVRGRVTAGLGGEEEGRAIVRNNPDLRFTA